MDRSISEKEFFFAEVFVDFTDVLPWYGVGRELFVEFRTAKSVVHGLLRGHGEPLGLSAVSSVETSSAEIA